MCGIIGYIGCENALPYLMNGLETLEYRGYDSVGIAQAEKDGSFEIRKTAGKISKLKEILKNEPMTPSSCGIGHTRWATNGEPSQKNAHPHTAGKTALVHNGIIDNDAEIKERLKDEYKLISETDTEAAACLIDHYINETGDIVSAIFKASSEIKGSYAFVLMNKNSPGKLFAIRRDSPLIAAKTADGYVFASDITAVINKTNEFYRVKENIVAAADENSLTFFDENKNTVSIEPEKIMWSRDAAEKNGYPHFMLKEIHEEPEVLRRTVKHYLKNGIPDFSSVLSDKISAIHIAACGSAMHAGLIGKIIIEKLARIPVSVEIASEFRYRDPVIHENAALILISQSGETADTLAAMRYAKERGIKTISIVNVPGSTLARESDAVIYTQAGPEIAVATTKAYVAQCAVLYLIAIYLAEKSGKISREDCVKLCDCFINDVPTALESAINNDNTIKTAEKIAPAQHLFYIGRGIDSAICTEASLKLKEISYLHSEAYAAGELKHGTISLIENGTPVIAVMTDSALYDKTLTGVKEVKERGAYTVTVSTSKESDIVLPKINELFAMFPAITKLQLLAYHTAILRGCDVDQPRNLAKSVTVE